MSSMPATAQTAGLERISARRVVPARRLVLALAAWAGVSVIFAAVQSTTELNPNKPALFLLFANAVHFGLWALTVPLLRVLVNRFPLQRGDVARHALVLLPSCFAIAFVCLEI